MCNNKLNSCPKLITFSLCPSLPAPSNTWCCPIGSTSFSRKWPNVSRIMTLHHPPPPAVEPRSLLHFLGATNGNMLPSAIRSKCWHSHREGESSFRWCYYFEIIEKTRWNFWQLRCCCCCGRNVWHGDETTLWMKTTFCPHPTLMSFGISWD